LKKSALDNDNFLIVDNLGTLIFNESIVPGGFVTIDLEPVDYLLNMTNFFNKMSKTDLMHFRTLNTKHALNT